MVGDFVDTDELKDKIKDFILTADFNQIFDFLEGINNFFNKYGYDDVEKDINILFETEQVEHRFLEGKIIDITDKSEVEEIKNVWIMMIKLVNI